MKRMYALVLLVAILSGCAPAVKPGALRQTSNLDAGIAALAERMSSRMSPDHGLRIAVLPFVELQSNAADPFGKYLAEGLIAHLAPLTGNHVQFTRGNGAQDYNLTLSPDGSRMEGYFVGSHDPSVGTEVTLTRK